VSEFDFYIDVLRALEQVGALYADLEDSGPMF
jgi:hypothetical protein